MASENKTIGRFSLDGIPPSPRGVPQVEVSFDIDANGILNVSAKDRATGKEQRITITASSGLAKDEVERMVQEAEAHADEDRTKKELVEARNQLDSLVYNGEKNLREHGDKIPDETKTSVETAISSAKEALNTDDVTQITTAMEGLSAALTQIGEFIYSSTDQEAEGPTVDGTTAEDGEEPKDTIDGEYREV